MSKEDLKSLVDMRYTVLKNEDQKCLTDTEYEIFTSILKRINEHRISNNKNQLIGLFINQEWECYDDVLKILIDFIKQKDEETECRPTAIH